MKPLCHDRAESIALTFTQNPSASQASVFRERVLPEQSTSTQKYTGLNFEIASVVVPQLVASCYCMVVDNSRKCW